MNDLKFAFLYAVFTLGLLLVSVLLDIYRSSASTARTDGE